VWARVHSSSWLGDNFGEYVCEDDVLSITPKRITIGGFVLFRTSEVLYCKVFLLISKLKMSLYGNDQRYTFVSAQ